MCYRSWEPGLNPNVRKVREDQEAYLQNILKQQHGSVLQHASFTFVLHNVSRVFCYDDDTDVLTDEGWKPWPKVDGTETLRDAEPGQRRTRVPESYPDLPRGLFRADVPSSIGAG